MKKIMQLVVMLFWAIILGQVLSFICASLTESVYQPVTTTVVCAVFAVIIYVINIGMQHFNLNKK